MTARIPTAVRRLWPQRLRTRLAVFYSLLFLAAGLGLLALAFTLAIAVLAPPHAPSLERLTPAQVALLQHCKPLPSTGKLLSECKHLLGLVGSTRNGTVVAGLKIALVICGVLVVGGAVLLGWLAAGRSLRPVRAITDAALRASELRLGQRLALSGPEDELKALGDTFDLMLDRLDAAFTSQRRFVANAAHELRTPLTAMRTAIEVTLFKPDRTPEQLDEMALRVKRSVDRAEATIEALLTLATTEAGRATTEPIDLATAAEDAIDSLQGTIRQRGLRVEAALDPAPTSGDRVLLERMIANLVENAVRHNEPGGWLAVETGKHNGSSVFKVANSGPEVAVEQLATLFEPFTRAQQRINLEDGVGLGLSIADAIARAHDATIEAQPRPGGGLEVSVALEA